MPDTIRGRGSDAVHAVTPLAAASFRNRTVYSQTGQAGKVANVLIGDDARHYAVVDFGAGLGSHQVPLASFAYEGGRFVVHESDVRRLPVFVDGQKGLRAADAGATLNIAGYSAGAEADDAMIFVQDAAPHITVERPPLRINWEQAAPQVTVHQPTPQVNVRQRQPVIIVRRPSPPRILVELDQPEIIVRMPDPEVQVSIAEPQVQVNVPRPFVQVEQPEQPQVKISSGEPLISLLPRHAAEIAIERGQAEVRYERIGEPQITFRQGEGAPKVRFEEMTRQEAIKSAIATATAMKMSQLEGRHVFSSDGDEVGTVQRTLLGQGGKLLLVVARGGFMGFAAHRILLPVTSFALRGDRLIIPTMAAAEIGRLEAWDENLSAFTPAPPDRLVHIAHWS